MTALGSGKIWILVPNWSSSNHRSLMLVTWHVRLALCTLLILKRYLHIISWCHMMGKFITLKKNNLYYKIVKACMYLLWKIKGLKIRRVLQKRYQPKMFSSQSNEETVNGNGTQTEPLLNSNISVSEAIQVVFSC